MSSIGTSRIHTSLTKCVWTQLFDFFYLILIFEVWMFLIYAFYGFIGDIDIVHQQFDWKNISIMHNGCWFLTISGPSALLSHLLRCIILIGQYTSLNYINTYLMMLTHLMTFMLFNNNRWTMIAQWFMYKTSIFGMWWEIIYLKSNIRLLS